MNSAHRLEKRTFIVKVILIPVALLIIGAVIHIYGKIFAPEHILDTIAGGFYGAAIGMVVTELSMIPDRRASSKERDALNLKLAGLHHQNRMLQTEIDKANDKINLSHFRSRRIAFELGFHLKQVDLADEAEISQLSDKCLSRARELHVLDSVKRALTVKDSARVWDHIDAIRKDIREKFDREEDAGFTLGYVLSAQNPHPSPQDIELIPGLMGVFGVSEPLRNWAHQNLMAVSTVPVGTVNLFYTILVGLLNNLNFSESYEKLIAEVPSIVPLKFAGRATAFLHELVSAK